MSKSIDEQIIIKSSGCEIPITSKDIKYFNNINQELKAIFNDYIIRDNIVISGKDDFLVLKGYHIAVVPFAPLALDTKSLEIVYYSKGIFAAFKANKSALDKIVYGGKNSDDNKIYVTFTTGDVVAIGEVVRDAGLYFHNKLYDHGKYIKLPDEFIRMPESKVITMCDKYPITLEPGMDFETVITRELIPGLKNTKTKTTKASYAMKNTKDPDVFELYLKATQEFIISYHKYKCFRW